MCNTSISIAIPVADRDRKRKASSDSDGLYRQSIVRPCFIGVKVLKSMHPSRKTFVERDVASFESLPQELFCAIVAYLGPTSTSLCSLAQITRGHIKMMKTIGDVMIPVAKSRFRTPLPPKSESESSISLFVRHARAAKDVHDHLLVLEDTLEKDFPTVESIRDNSFFKSENTVLPREVDHALDVALCLLGAGQRHSYLSLKSDVEIFEGAARLSANAATTALEWRVSKVCAAIGAKAYKYAQAMMCDPAEYQFNSPYQVTDQFSEVSNNYVPYHVTDEFNAPIQVSDEFHEGEDELSVDSFHEANEDTERLNKACMVMQLTVTRDMENQQIRLGARNISAVKSTFRTIL